MGKEEDPDFRLSDISELVDWKQAKKMGDILRHHYEDVKPQTIWSTTTEFLPTVESETQRALQEYSAFYDQQPSQHREEPEQEP